jgi:hypothetical protein
MGRELLAAEYGNSIVRYMPTGKAPLLYVRMPQHLPVDDDTDKVDNEDYEAVEYSK